MKPNPISVAPAGIPETEKTVTEIHANNPATMSAIPVIKQTMPMMPMPSTIARTATIKPKTVLMAAHKRENQNGDVRTTAIINRTMADLFFSFIGFFV